MDKGHPNPEIRFGSQAACAVLRAAYEAACGKYLRPVSYEQIAARVPVSRDEFQTVARGLEASGYSRHSTDALDIALEHAGLDWVEQSAFPEDETDGTYEG